MKFAMTKILLCGPVKTWSQKGHELYKVLEAERNCVEPLGWLILPEAASGVSG